MGLGEVSVLGLGCARLGSLTEPRSRRESLALIAAAVNAGITLFDTGTSMRKERANGFWEKR